MIQITCSRRTVVATAESRFACSGWRGFCGKEGTEGGELGLKGGIGGVDDGLVCEGEGGEGGEGQEGDKREHHGGWGELILMLSVAGFGSREVASDVVVSRLYLRTNPGSVS